MDLSDHFSLDHLIFKERTCRICGKTKSLMDDFYLTRKDRSTVPSAYSYECKTCTVKRIIESRKRKRCQEEWGYPDW
jgi:hypothetical protein